MKVLPFFSTPPRALAVAVILLLLTGACSPKINIVRDHSEPLKEYTLQGTSRGKILLIHVRGFIGTAPRSGLLREDPSLVQEVSARLRKAADDEQVKAVVLAIDSPGGSVTASDILYQQIMRHKQKTGQKVVALLMGLAASGGYYTAAAADRIMAHPTTITGSIGTVFIRPDLAGLMDKIGVQAEVTKSGKYKDISSWFRHSDKEERKLLQQMIDRLNARFLEVVQTRRKLTEQQLATVAQAGVYTADQARELGLVDAEGYAQDAFDLAASLAGLDNQKDKDEAVTVVTYRREEFADDTAYNTMALTLSPASLPSLTSLPVLDNASQALQALEPGFHHIWLPGSRTR